MSTKSEIKVGTLVLVIKGHNTGKVGEVVAASGKADFLVEFPEPIPACGVSGAPTGRLSRRLWGFRESLMPIPPLDELDSIVQSAPASNEVTT